MKKFLKVAPGLCATPIFAPPATPQTFKVLIFKHL